MLADDQAPQHSKQFADISHRGSRISDEILAREALMRSFRWVFAIRALHVSALHVMVFLAAVASAKPEDVSRLRFTLGVTLVMVWLIGWFGFWGLTRPRKWTRAYLLLLTLFYGFGTMMSALSLLEKDLVVIPGFVRAQAAEAVMGTMFLLVNIAMVVLAYRGAGPSVYSRRGIQHLAKSRNLLPESPWIAVGFVVLIVGWYVGNAYIR